MAEDSTAQFQLPGETESWDVGNGFSAAEDKQPSHTQSSEHQHQEAYSVDRSHVVSGDAPDDGADDSAEYDPESLSTMDDTDDTHRLIAPPATAPAPATDSQHAPKAAKTVSGFVVDSDDDEEDVDTAAKAIPPAPSGAQGVQSKTTFSSSNVPQETVLVPQPTLSVSAPPVEKSSVSGMVPPGAQPVAPVLAEDNIAFLERRVQKDPRGEVDAWLELMREHRARNQYDELRRVYERFLEIFPHSAEIWVESVNFELNIDNFAKAEDIFRQCLMTVPSVSVWTTYLDYIRRRNDLSDPTGQARQVITQAYEFVLSNVGIDKESGKLWQDYIQFIRNGPGQIGGSSWQDQQKMDLLRKTYQRALAVPTACLQAIWKEYDAFEMGLNKMTGRKFLQERSPGYMTARSANTTLENAIRGLVRTSIPRLPPAKGFAGDDEYMEQVECWKRWVAWEKEDPLSIRSEDAQGFQRRVLHCYKQALMALRFWPKMWVDAAEWCFENNLVEPKDMGMEFLNEGIKANPESVLLALKLADRLEMTSPIEEGEAAKIERGKLVRAPYDTLLDTLYEMLKQLKEREEQDVKKIEQDDIPFLPPPPPNTADDDDDANDADKAKDDAKKQLIDHVKKGIAVQTDLLKRTVTFVWIALFRAMRRVQGKGQPKGPGARGIFQEARARGRLTSDIYAAIAQVEWNVYKDASSTKIFDRGAKLFPTDEHLILDYLKHLHSQHDTTNARVVFETFVNKVTQNPELVHKAKPVYLYFHKYESYYGELSHIAKLEKRMTELFPDDPKLSHFASRFSNNEEYGVDSFDPLSVRLIISPAAQMKPKTLVMPSIEPAQSVRSMSRPISRDGFSPRPQMLPAVNSPKRALEDFDDSSRPRKIVRGESPLKGAAGRRLDQQRRNQGGASTSGVQPLPISRDITFLLGLIPPASTYNARPYAPHRVVKLLQDTPLPSFQEWKASQNQDKSSRQMPTHNRQQSTEYPGYPTYGQPGRNSPVSSGPGGSRPMSPYDANMRRGVAPIVPASATYRNSPLRPETGGYDPPPASYPPPPAGYGSAPTLIDSSTPWGYAPPPPTQGGSYPPQTQYPPRYHY